MIPVSSPDPTRAFLPYPQERVSGAADGLLSGLRFAVKDLFDVAGYPTGCGNPLMMAMRPCAPGHADAVARLLGAGAAFCGKTHTDELAWSLFGENVHYGTPRNPAAPDRLPGGSSSGSAVAVAASLVDVALGTDTGGSIRVPASFCGIWGIRPTHGRVSLCGAMPLAPGFDTCGWFARNAATLARLAPVLLEGEAVAATVPRLLLATDMVARTDDATQALIASVLARLPVRPEQVTVYGETPERLNAMFVTLQACEAYQSLGEWVRLNDPILSPSVAGRFARAATLSVADHDAAAALRMHYTDWLDARLGSGTVLIAPVVPGEAPLLGLSGAAADGVRTGMIDLLCIAGLTGRPQVVFPIGTGPNGAPIGLSLIGERGSDEQLIAMAASLATILEIA